MHNNYYHIDTTTHHHPGGMLMPGRSFNSPTYRFGMNGQEKDDEITGTTGSHYTALYWEYDSRILRRWNVEPKSSKYPYLSPYCVFENNPIYLADPTGEDGVAVVDKENKTITIKAVYYVQTVENPGIYPTSTTKYTAKDVENLNKKVNSTLNGASYTVTEGEYKGYNVKFDFTFKEGGESWELEGEANKEKYDNIPIGNTFKKGNERSYPTTFKEPSKDGKTRGGVTDKNKFIVMRTGMETNRTRIHEIFHTLFFDKDDAEKGIGSYKKENDMPNQQDINDLINNNQLPKTETKDK